MGECILLGTVEQSSVYTGVNADRPFGDLTRERCVNATKIKVKFIHIVELIFVREDVIIISYKIISRN